MNLSSPMGPVIDQGDCTGCGKCVADCPAQVLDLRQRRAAVVRLAACMDCGHCLAVCPEAAVRLPMNDEAMANFQTFDPANGEAVDIASLTRLMQMRRSCRAFTAQPVPRPVLEDLVRLAITAPSGTNSQPWTFAIAPDRPAVEALARRVAKAFAQLNALARRPTVRFASRLVHGDRLQRYYEEHYESVEQALRDWDEHGVDRLFWGAPAVIAVAGRQAASCPAEDALLATSQIVLGAAAMGLGTCLIGFAVAAMAQDPSIATWLGMPADERVHAVIALGTAQRSYQRPAGRHTAPIRWMTI